MIEQLVHRYNSEHCTPPGRVTTNVEVDVGLLKCCLTKLVTEGGGSLPPGQYDEHIDEVIDKGGGGGPGPPLVTAFFKHPTTF